jgi:hypothetical protein
LANLDSSGGNPEVFLCPSGPSILIQGHGPDAVANTHKTVGASRNLSGKTQ